MSDTIVPTPEATVGFTSSLYYSGMGRPPLRERMISFSTKLPAAIRDRLEAYAVEAGVPMNDVLIRAIELYTSRPRRVIPYPRPTVPRPKR